MRFTINPLKTDIVFETTSIEAAREELEYLYALPAYEETEIDWEADFALFQLQGDLYTDLNSFCQRIQQAFPLSH